MRPQYQTLPIVPWMRLGNPNRTPWGIVVVVFSWSFRRYTFNRGIEAQSIICEKDFPKLTQLVPLEIDGSKHSPVFLNRSYNSTFKIIAEQFFILISCSGENLHLAAVALPFTASD